MKFLKKIKSFWYVLIILLCVISNILLVVNSEVALLQEEDASNQYSIGQSSAKRHYRDPIFLPSFPESISLVINVVFIGINRIYVNTTQLLESLPKTSQISRYVPLSYEYENYINYSLVYRLHFMETQLTIDYSNSIADYGTYGFNPEMGIYWSGRTNITTYKRLDPSSARTWLEDNLQQYKADNDEYLVLDETDVTIFISNLFVNGSLYYANQNAVPHTYFHEEVDIDTQQISNIRKEGRYSPEFDWKNKRWVMLDISSGPSTYETVMYEYTNYIEYLEGMINAEGVAQEYTTLIRSAVYSRYTPTFLYEPIWKENMEICIVIYHDSNFTVNDFIDINTIRTSFIDLFYSTAVQLTLKWVEISAGDNISTFLEDIQSFTDYSTWASRLVEFVKFHEDDLFGSYDSHSTERYLCGVFATSLISGEREDPIERALGYTYAYLGIRRAMGSVVTIPPKTVLEEGEGYTQTIIHEIGHATSLRHPHDFRYNGDLYNIWSWDVCNTPLSYLTSIYQYEMCDKDFLYRGNYRYLFNQTYSNFHGIQDTMEAKSFPADSYPSSIFQDIYNVSQQFNDSIEKFTEHDYEESLSEIIPAYLLLGEIQDNITHLSDYYEPAINFYTINETVMDYGDDFSISGKIVSYEKPNVTISSNNYTRQCEINILFSEEYLYETEFSIEASSILFGKPDGNSIFDVIIFDGVVYFHHSIVISFQTLDIKIISPTNGMTLDLSHADSFTILGFYHSVSNTSTLQILYGGYWFVQDHEDNQSFWTDLTKDINNEWSLDANSSSFINGANLVIVKITNAVSFREDRIQLEISGLPEPSNWSGEITSATPPDSSFSPTKEEMSPLIEFIQQSWFLFLCIGGVFSIIVLRDIRQWYIQNQSMKSISPKTPKPSRHLKDLIKTINQKDSLSDTIDNLKKIPFKPKRRK